MEQIRMAVVGVGAIGSVLAAALISNYPDTVLVGRRNRWGNDLIEKGLAVSGEISYRVPVKYYSAQIGTLKESRPTLVFLATKTFHLAEVLEELAPVVESGAKIVATQNGLGVEDLVAEKLSPNCVFRMSLNFGAALKGPGTVETAFFNRPNHLGAVASENRALGLKVAGILSDCGLDTQLVEDIKLFVWRKMIMKCTMASICAVTGKTIRDALNFAPTREVADACFREALAVAGAMGYDLGEDYLQQALGYLEKVGDHRDSMCTDIENKTPTEIDFLGAKIVEYGRANGIPTPYYVTMTNLVKALEDNYLKG